MMTAELEVIRAGAGTTIQDRGRFLLRRYGVTPSGPMDWTAFQTVQHVLGNAEDAAAIEIGIGGIEVAASGGPIEVAFGGGGFIWTRNDKPLAPAMRITLHPGERLAAKPGAWGAFAYLAAAGGFDTPIDMGSRATHLRSRIGSPMIHDGDRVSTFGKPQQDLHADALIDAPWLVEHSDQPMRVLLGPQDDYFATEAIAVLFSSPFALEAASDRMAYRLSGAKIEHALGFNIVSDGIALGAIQIGGDGQLLVLMADHQPTGGYPKIGYIIRADIGRLAQMRPGEACRFVPCSMEKARTELFALEEKIAATSCKELKIAAGFSTELLRSINLIDGVVDL